MNSATAYSTPGISPIISVCGVYKKRKPNRIASSDESIDEDTSGGLVKSSRDFQPASAAGKRALMDSSFTSSICKRQKNAYEKKSSSSDLDDLSEDPVEAQPKEFGSCPRGVKRMSRLNILRKTQKPDNFFLRKKRRLEREESESESNDREISFLSKRNIEEDFPNSQEQLQSLIEDESTDSDDDKSIRIRKKRPLKTILKTPSNTFDDFSTDDDILQELDDNTSVSGEDLESVVLLRSKEDPVYPCQILEVEIKESPIRVDNYMVHIADKYKIIDEK
ncbi:hypothetical protein DMENIID0001_126930 [Sergentomyia squamirostris]